MGTFRVGKTIGRKSHIERLVLGQAAVLDVDMTQRVTRQAVFTGIRRVEREPNGAEVEIDAKEWDQRAAFVYFLFESQANSRRGRSGVRLELASIRKLG